MTDSPAPKYAPHRVRDRSIVLLVLATVMILPPFVSISLVDTKIAGMPVPLLYVFVVWILLIVGAAFFARPLAESDQGQEPSHSDTTDGS